MSKVTVVCGAGGFIGGHLTKDLIEQGIAVRAIDLKPLANFFNVILTRREIEEAVRQGLWLSGRQEIGEQARVKVYVRKIKPVTETEYGFLSMLRVFR